MSIATWFVDFIKSLPHETAEMLREYASDKEEEIVKNEEARSMRKLADVLLETKVPKEKILTILQKCFDLRPSEAERVLTQAENRAKRR